MAQIPNPLKLRLLGGFELQSGQASDTAPAGRKVRALLAYLALSPGTRLPREKLMALLWSDRAEQQARASLRQALTELRQALGEPSPLRTDQDTVTLDAAAIAVDAIEFSRLAKAGKLDEATALYRGPLLDGHGVRDGAFEDWLLVERTRFHDIAVDVLHRVADSQTGHAAIGTAQRLLQLDPAREATYRLLMRLYADGGQRAQALRQYQLCRDALWRDLQATPDSETERLHREIQDESPLAQPMVVRVTGASTVLEQRPMLDMLGSKKVPVTGGCLCGEIRYRVTEPALDTNFCHCRMCQRFSGGPFSVGSTYHASAVQFTKGEPRYYKSSPFAERGFCANCGSSLTFRALVPPVTAAWADWILIFTGSLDNPAPNVPTWHLGVESQMPWADIQHARKRVRCQDSPDLVEAWAAFDLPVP